MEESPGVAAGSERSLLVTRESRLFQQGNVAVVVDLGHTLMLIE